MSTVSPEELSRKTLVIEYLERMKRAYRGESVDRFELLAPDVLIGIPGSTPASGSLRGREALAAASQQLMPLFAPGFDFDILIERVIAEGDTVVVIARGRAEAASGRPYNNSYLMWFRVEDGLIQEMREYCDLAHILWAIYGKDIVWAD